MGLQKSYYRRSLTQPLQATRSTTDEPWLPNATLAINPTKSFVVFGSYTRGWEQSGVAPENASNRGEVLPASITEQFDAGVSYQLSEKSDVGGRRVRDHQTLLRPEHAGLFARSGVTRHRGFELSLSGATIARAVDRRGNDPDEAADSAVRIRRPRNVPPGRPSRTVRFNAQYGPPAWRGFAVNAAVAHRGPVYFDRLNTLKLPGLRTLNIGARYDFTVNGGHDVA